MKLTREDQLAAEAGGCQFQPATESQVQRLTMQQRIFWIDGRAHVAMRRDGFMETAGTLRRLLQDGASRRAAAPATAVAAPVQAVPVPPAPAPVAVAPPPAAPPPAAPSAAAASAAVPFVAAPPTAAPLPAVPPPEAPPSKARSSAVPPPVVPSSSAALVAGPAAPPSRPVSAPPAVSAPTPSRAATEDEAAKPPASAPARKRARAALTSRPRSNDPLVLAAHIATARMAGPGAEDAQLPALMASVHETLARLTPAAGPGAGAERPRRARPPSAEAKPRAPARRRPTDQSAD